MKKNLRYSRAARATILGIAAGIPAAIGSAFIISHALAVIPPTPVPAENPITEAKRVLGKIIFFDEQLSQSNTMACATCHTMSRGGSDNRQARNPGADGLFNTPDDMLGSPGVIHADSNNSYIRDSVYGLLPQVTGRAAGSPVNAAFATDLFWDGRARSQFIDPQTSTVAIVSGGALESQCVNPPVSSVEMAHEGVNWTQIIAKMGSVRPLDLATNLPADVAAALADHPTYATLFQRAYGDGAITTKRIAFAIGTWERTLISDQSPWDLFAGGQQNALTPGQVQGFNTFNQNCVVCHAAQPGVHQGLFTDESFRNIGLRPPAEDLGRQTVTGDTADRGKFKVPSLRNVGLKRSYMHNGEFSNLNEVVAFYARAPGAPQQFPDNKDPAINAINIPPQAAPGLVDFLANALTDPRVANQQFPFDRPTLFTERLAQQPTVLGGGTVGSGGVVPQILVDGPALVGNADYRVGLNGVLGGAAAQLWTSLSPPSNGQISKDGMVAGVVADATGVATAHWALMPPGMRGGQVIYAQWFVSDPAGAGNLALSTVGRIPIFCGSFGCPNTCGSADFDGDGSVGTDADIDAFFACLSGNCCSTCDPHGADFNGDGAVGTDADIEAFFRVLAGGAC
jgi:cytochrome c peroxidase